MEKIKKLPPIGLRIIKSAVTVALCFAVSHIRGNGAMVYQSQLAALWCIQMYAVDTKKNAMQRISATTIGAAYGLIYLLIRDEVTELASYNILVDQLIISFMIIVILYTTVVLDKKQASYFSCVVFLSVAITYTQFAEPYMFVWNRFLDTIIGLAIGISVNSFSLPREKKKDILFISGLDDTLLENSGQLSAYSKVELNRMLDDGLNFTISTIRTPASLVETMESVRLRLPVIAMDGAVLYDIHKKEYLKVYVISPKRARAVLALIHKEGLNCFINVVIDDMLVIYYEESEDEIQRQLIESLRKSPYRNFVNRTLPETENVVYFMIIDKKETVERFYHVLEKNEITQKLKVIMYDSVDYTGYSYLKIYNRNASKTNMVSLVKNMLDVEKVVTIGSIPKKYDIVVKSKDRNQVVKLVKKHYEPIKSPFRKNENKKSIDL